MGHYFVRYNHDFNFNSFTTWNASLFQSRNLWMNVFSKYYFLRNSYFWFPDSSVIFLGTSPRCPSTRGWSLGTARTWTRRWSKRCSRPWNHMNMKKNRIQIPCYRLKWRVCMYSDIAILLICIPRNLFQHVKLDDIKWRFYFSWLYFSWAKKNVSFEPLLGVNK